MTEAVWHDIECGSYDADLDPLGGAGRRPAPRDVLDLGCGTGRVSVPLARRGRRVTGVDTDPRVPRGRWRSARGARRSTSSRVCRGRALVRPRPPFDLVLAPMQLVQLFGAGGARCACSSAVAAHLRPGGLFAAALLDLEGESGRRVRPPAARHAGESTAGSTRASRSRSLARRRRGDRRSIACARPCRPTASRASRRAIRLELLSPRRARTRDRSGRPGACRTAGSIPPTEEHVGSIVVLGDRPKAP